MQSVETERLRLRMITPQDAAFIQRLYSSEDFLRYIGDKEINDTEKAVEYIENNILKMHEEKGVCLLMVEIKETSTPIGICGLIKRDTLASHDIGYGFAPEFYGQGFAQEAAEAIIEQAKQNADIDHLVAITTSDNIRSITLLTKLGFVFERVEDVISESVNLNLYGFSLGN
ncbi:MULTISPECIES: GNAT family N-acetyltransferase [Vibrio]|uniref:GNAT family N-acetyltransferase n=1 Tax=Vibrio TaxID=662 RepID=UPI0002F9DFBC|nr:MULTISPECIES: GNAT family N-acetyltransferase [Vibrio]MCC4889691.1 GNAT family N-acetyltransferase [Vibrio sp. F13]NOH93967.1 GNAT family N-acetyltransferase [Vibrio sp. AIC-3]OCH50993.1 acetyltransferase [Vibrio sp. ZF57]OED86739.1 GNAT family N-acetyltransferase [Vibrio crassostreae ZF-91]OEE94278.1 GNAT family N-acetyltransferase [Vibrio crassostreae 9ZC77]